MYTVWLFTEVVCYPYFIHVHEVFQFSCQSGKAMCPFQQMRRTGFEDVKQLAQLISGIFEPSLLSIWGWFFWGQRGHNQSKLAWEGRQAAWVVCSWRELLLPTWIHRFPPGDQRCLERLIHQHLWSLVPISQRQINFFSFSASGGFNTPLLSAVKSSQFSSASWIPRAV